jgi:Holliday junction resolvase
MSEKSIETAIKKYLKKIGGKVQKQHGSVYGRNGVPDLLACYQGRFLALEVKRPGEDTTPLQKHELAGWEAAGALAARVESVEDVQILLEGINV